MKSDYELIQEYKDISKTNKPKIAPYCEDMFIDVEMEYLMRKDLQQRIDKAIEYIKEQGCYEEDNKQFCDDIDYDKLPNLLEILRGTKNENN